MENVDKNFQSIWKNWKITQEWIDGIKSGNQDCVSAFYFENYNHLVRYCRRVCRWYCNSSDSMSDVLHCIYIDIPLFDFSSEKSFYFSLRSSIWLTFYGGLSLVLEYDKKYRSSLYHIKPLSLDSLCSSGKGSRHQDDKNNFSFLMLSDYATESVEDLYLKGDCFNEKEEELSPLLLDFLKKFFPKKQLEHLSLRLLGFKYISIQNELKCSDNLAWYYSTQCRMVLIRNYKEIVKFLYDNGFASGDYLGLIPDDYDKSLEFYEKRKASSRLCARKRLERIKKESLKN